MTAIQLNAELLREISMITEDESMLVKAIKAIRRIRTSHKTKSKAVTADVLPELPESIKNLQGMVTFSPEEIEADARLSYLHNK
jgi:hypothetical protein